MSHSSGFLSTAEALRNVFLPAVRYTVRSPRLPPLPSQCQIHRPFQRRYAVASPSSSFNTTGQIVSSKRKSTTGNRRNRDEGIPSQDIHIVQPNGRLGEAQSLYSALKNIDRRTCHIEQHSIVNGIPVCKIIDKKEAHFAAKARKKHKPPSAVTKYLELNWTIDKNDLAHRLAKLRDFLEQGRRVEVFLCKKRKHTRHATEEEGRRTLESVQNLVKDVEGVKEIRPMEGKLLERAILYFEGSQKVSDAAEERERDQKPVEDYETNSHLAEDTPAKQAGYG